MFVISGERERPCARGQGGNAHPDFRRGAGIVGRERRWMVTVLTARPVLTKMFCGIAEQAASPAPARQRDAAGARHVARHCKEKIDGIAFAGNRSAARHIDTRGDDFAVESVAPATTG